MLYMDHFIKMKSKMNYDTGFPIILTYSAALFSSLLWLPCTNYISQSFYHHVFLSQVVLLKLDQRCRSATQRIVHDNRSVIYCNFFNINVVAYPGIFNLLPSKF